MQPQLIKGITHFMLLASVPAIVSVAPSALADVPTRPQLIASQPINQAGLAGWMPQSIAKRFEGSKIYIDEAKFDGGISVGFAYTASCSGTACSAGQITISKTETEKEGQPVQLANGIIGYVSSSSGAMNGITWQQGGLNYQLNFKLSSKDMVTYANYVIKKMEKQ